MYVPKETLMKILQGSQYEYFGEENGYIKFVYEQPGELDEIVKIPIINIDGNEFVEYDGRKFPGSIVMYSTPKDVPGWAFCKTTGEWFSESEIDDRCPEDYAEFEISLNLRGPVDREIEEILDEIKSCLSNMLARIDEIAPNGYYDDPGKMAEFAEKCNKIERLIQEF